MNVWCFNFYYVLGTRTGIIINRIFEPKTAISIDDYGFIFCEVLGISPWISFFWFHLNATQPNVKAKNDLGVSKLGDLNPNLFHFYPRKPFGNISSSKVNDAHSLSRQASCRMDRCAPLVPQAEKVTSKVRSGPHRSQIKSFKKIMAVQRTPPR